MKKSEAVAVVVRLARSLAGILSHKSAVYDGQRIPDLQAAIDDYDKADADADADVAPVFSPGAGHVPECFSPTLQNYSCIMCGLPAVSAKVIDGRVDAWCERHDPELNDYEKKLLVAIDAKNAEIERLRKIARLMRAGLESANCWMRARGSTTADLECALNVSGEFSAAAPTERS